jgi:hypothetical protein
MFYVWGVPPCLCLEARPRVYVWAVSMSRACPHVYAWGVSPYLLCLGRVPMSMSPPTRVESPSKLHLQKVRLSDELGSSYVRGGFKRVEIRWVNVSEGPPAERST